MTTSRIQQSTAVERPPTPLPRASERASATEAAGAPTTAGSDVVTLSALAVRAAGGEPPESREREDGGEGGEPTAQAAGSSPGDAEAVDLPGARALVAALRVGAASTPALLAAAHAPSAAGRLRALLTA